MFLFKDISPVEPRFLLFVSVLRGSGLIETAILVASMVPKSTDENRFPNCKQNHILKNVAA